MCKGLKKFETKMIMVGQNDDQDKEARVLFGSRNKTLHVHHAHLLEKKTNTPCVNLTSYSTQYANIDGVPSKLSVLVFPPLRFAASLCEPNREMAPAIKDHV